MSYFVVVPGALIPAAIAPSVLKQAKFPALARLLRRAPTPTLHEAPAAADGAAHLFWLWTQFGGSTPMPVTAPYAWRALNGAGALDVQSELPLWHVDPVHFALARDHLLVTPLDAATLALEDLAALATEAAEASTEFGASLRVQQARHWFISFDPPWQLDTVALDAALGRSAQDVLPRGGSAARWRKLHTEIQIRWHQNPINERREAQGARAINGLWLHGGGVWAPLPRRPFNWLATSDATLCGWGLASGLPPSALLHGDTMPSPPGPTLAYRDELLQAACFDAWEQWLATFERLQTEIVDRVGRALAAGLGSATLVFAGRRHVRTIEVRSSDRFKFWRNASVEAMLVEPESA